MKCLKVFVMAAIFSLALVPCAFSATLRGKVLCEDGRSVRSPVTIEILGLDEEFTITTSTRGNYAIVIPIGEYRFVIEGQECEVFVYEENAPRYFYIPCR